MTVMVVFIICLTALAITYLLVKGKVDMWQEEKIVWPLKQESLFKITTTKPTIQEKKEDK